MAWTYHTWTTETGLAARLTALRAHVAEVSAKIGNEIAGDGKSLGSSSLQNYHESLMKELEKLEARAQRQGLAGGTGSVSQVRIVDAE